MSENIDMIFFKKTKKGRSTAYILGRRLYNEYGLKSPISVEEAEKLILEGKAREIKNKNYLLELEEKGLASCIESTAEGAVHLWEVKQ